jgi:hypothetical protein
LAVPSDFGLPVNDHDELTTWLALSAEALTGFNGANVCDGCELIELAT